MEKLRVSCPRCSGISATNLGADVYWCPNCEQHYMKDGSIDPNMMRDNIK